MAVVDGGLLPPAEIDSLMVKFGRMSALGHKRTFRIALAMSALSPKADIRQRGWNVRGTSRYFRRCRYLFECSLQELFGPLLKKRCNVATTCAPSPTADATRLTELERTSPMAKTPRWLVSSVSPSAERSLPVSTNPFESRAMPELASQPVFGSAPMKRN